MRRAAGDCAVSVRPGIGAGGRATFWAAGAVDFTTRLAMGSALLGSAVLGSAGFGAAGVLSPGPPARRPPRRPAGWSAPAPRGGRAREARPRGHDHRAHTSRR